MRTLIASPENEEYFKASLIRYPFYMENLQHNLKHRKDEILACKGCPQLQQQGENLLYTRSVSAVLDDDHVWAGSLAILSISTLLPELLLEIFHILTLEDPPLIRETWDASATKTLSTPHLGWIHVTHVCRRWRRLAVGTGALWTNFGHGLILGSSWTHEFIARAKGANVSIPPFDDYPRSLDLISGYIMDHSSHIRDITLSAEWTSVFLIWDFCDLFLPMTVSANLDAGKYNWHNADLFGGYAPNLRHLRLCNIVPWTAHSFLGNLIELDVFMRDDEPICEAGGVITVTGEVEPVGLFIFPPLAQVLDVLDEASSLEHLSLHYAIPPEDPSAEESRKVHFPCLKSFSMSSKVRDCVSFLNRIVLPHGVTLDLTCIPGLSPETFRDLFHALTYGVHSAGEPCPPIDRLELGTGRVDDRVLIRVYGGHANCLTRTYSSELFNLPPRLMITLSLAYASPQDHKVVLQSFFSSMPLQDLTYLSVYRCSTVQPEGWRSIIRDNYVFLQSVRFLVLGHDCAQYFFHAIHDKDDFLSGFGPTAFPNLDRLIFRRVDFSMFPRGDVSEASFEDQMLYHLRERIRGDKPLRAIFFFSCQGIEEEWFRSLEQLVKFVRLGL